jgi:hypothetical protein
MTIAIFKHSPYHTIEKIICCIMVLFMALRSSAECSAGQDCSSSSEISQKTGPKTRENIKPMWIAGVVSFSSIYILTIALTAALSEDDARGKTVGYAAAPIVGPFVAIGNDNDDITVDDYKIPLILSGIFQIASIGVMIAGLVIKRDVTLSMTVGPQKNVRLSFLPMNLNQGIAMRLILSHF